MLFLNEKKNSVCVHHVSKTMDHQAKSLFMKYIYNKCLAKTFLDCELALHLSYSQCIAFCSKWNSLYHSKFLNKSTAFMMTL